MSYNSQANSKMAKKSIYIKKVVDYEIPQNIMISISQWIDCYNNNIREKTKIKMHSEFEEKINDCDISSSMKMSKSGKRSENERLKYEKDIFGWVSSMSDDKVDYFSEKLSEYMRISKDVIIKSYINIIRLENKSRPFDKNYKEKLILKVKPDSVKKEEQKIQISSNEEYKKDKNGKILYGDAWDL